MAIVHALGWVFPDADTLKDALAPGNNIEKRMIIRWLDQEDAPRFLKLWYNNSHNKTSYIPRDAEGQFLVISTIAGPRRLGNLAYADALGFGYKLFKDSVDFRPSHILLDTTTFSFIHTPAGESPPENIDELLEGVETTVFLLNPPPMSKEERKMIGISEKTKLIVVKLGRSIPWCVVDPQRWGAEGAHGKTAMLYAVSYTPSDAPVPFLNYILHGCTVTVTAYHDGYMGTPHPSVLRFDEEVVLPIASRRLESGPYYLLRRHPELRMRVRLNDRKKDYPLILAKGLGKAKGSGIVLVEPVTMLHQVIGLKEHDLACHTSSLS